MNNPIESLCRKAAAAKHLQESECDRSPLFQRAIDGEKVSSGSICYYLPSRDRNSGPDVQELWPVLFMSYACESPITHSVLT